MEGVDFSAQGEVYLNKESTFLKPHRFTVVKLLI